MDLDVIVIGGIGIDTNIYLQSEEIDFSVEANFTENIDYVGQAGGYYSRGFAQLGYETGLIDYIGNDHLGQFIQDELKKDGITFLKFIDPSRESRRSVNFMYPDGRRKNFYDGKRHMDVKVDLESCEQFLSKTKYSHFNLMNWSRDLLQTAKNLGHTISCDLQDIVSLDDDYRQDFVNSANVLFFSSVNYKDPGPLMKYFLKRKPDLLLVAGMGSEGCAVGSKDGIWYYPPVEMIDDPIIDSNGAGDSLGVGFLSSYFIEGYDIEESILRGQIAARYACSLKASSSELITKRQLNHYHQRGKK